jgi:uncharacterized repeat protein (TIGR02543 family)
MGGVFMKRKLISKIIAGTVVSTTLFTFIPLKASAEWVNDYQGNWYYMQDNQKLTGWKRIDGQIYYFNENGKMQTGWIKAGSSWYFLQSNGVLKTGWINYNKKWYYADSSGVIQVGTINISGKIYIFDSNGAMKTSNIVINGEFYTIGEDGEVVGAKVPTPDKEYDDSGNCIQVFKNTDNNGITSPTDSKFNEVIEDKTDSDADPNEGRTFKVQLKDSNGADLKTKTVKYGKSIDLYEPTKDGYNFAGWNTKSDGSGKSYDETDSIKVKEDIILYAQWTEDNATYVDSITVKGSSNVVVNKTIQMTAEVSPSYATNANVTWSLTDGTGKATIDSNGVLTGVSSGTVTVTATAKDGSKVSGTKEVTVGTKEVTIPVSGISVSSTTGIYKITANGGTLQMKASVLPSDASNQDVIWSVENRTGSASISSSGLITAISDGTVTVKATAADGSGVVGSTTLTISGQSAVIKVTDITLNDGKIDSDGGALQMIATIAPTTATNKSVEWSIISGQDKATISSTGLLKALADGTVTVQAKAKDGSGIVETKDIAISGQKIKVSTITISGPDTITDTTPVTFTASVLPTSASDSSVTWTVENKTGSASISSSGLVTAISNGTVTVKAAAADDSGVTATRDITITGINATIPVTSIAVASKTGKLSISTDNGTLDMIATLLPSYATTTTPCAVTWSVISGSGTATIQGDSNSNTATLKAVTNGTVTVKATSKDYTSIYGTATVTLSGQFTEVNNITVNSTADEVEVGGKLQMSATVLPTNATYPNVTWSVENGTGTATISSDGILTGGTQAGTVNVVATAKDGTGVIGSKTITIIPQVKVTSIGVKGAYIPDTGIGTAEITSDKGSIQMNATIAPDSATNKGVIWSVEQVGDAGTDMTGKATIDSSTGVLTAVADGTVRVKATASDGSGVVGLEVITISNQVIKATGYTLKGFVGTTEATQITTDKGTLQMQASILPTNATTTPSAVIWSVEQAGDTGTTMTGKANIDSAGKLTAAANGTVKVKVTGTTTDGTVISGSEVITISGQIVYVTGITVTASSATVAVNTPLQMVATISPTTATNKTVTWSVISPSGTAIIGTDGKLIGSTVENVTVIATAKDGSGVVGSTVIAIK